MTAFALHIPFLSSQLQEVYVWLSVREDSRYNIFIGGRKKEQQHFLICRMTALLEEPLPEMFIEAFKTPSQLDSTKFPDSAVETCLIKDPAFRFWYFSGTKIQEEGGDSSSSILLFQTAFRMAEARDNSVTGYSETDGSGNVISAALDYSQFQKMFIPPGSRIIRDDIQQGLAEAGFVGQELTEWRLEDTPADYTGLIKKLVKAQILRIMSQQIPPVMLQLPFIYTGIPQGYPVIFCKQNDIFFGTAMSASVTGDHETGYMSSVQIGSIVPLRQAMRFSSLQIKDLGGRDGINLGFAFVNPASVYGNSDSSVRFDWRNCALFDTGRYLRDISYDGDISDKLVVLKELIGAGNDEPAIEQPGDSIGLLTDASDMRGESAALHELSSQEVETIRTRFSSSTAGIDNLSPYIKFRKSMFTREITRLYTDRIAAMLVSSDVLTDYLESLSVSTNRITDIEAELAVLEPTPENDAAALTLQEEISSERKNISDIQHAVFKYLGIIEGDIDKEWVWFWRYIPVCAGMQEADSELYSDLLTPALMFGDGSEGQANVRYDIDSDTQIAQIQPLKRSDITGVSTREAALRLYNFIDSIRRNVVPFRALSRASGSDTIIDTEEE